MILGLSESIKPEKCNVLPAENYFTPSGNEILILLKSAAFEEKEYMGMKYLVSSSLYFGGDLKETTGKEVSLPHLFFQ